jgi:hypothetical protein
MALLPSGHAAFETVGQIRIADFMEGGDDLSLSGVCQFHFALCCHARIYAARNSEPEFPRKFDRGRCRWRYRTGLELPCGLLQVFLRRCAYGTSIRNSAAVSVAEVDTDDRRVGVNGKAENLALKADNDT